MKKILDKVTTKVLEGINLLALKLTARSANLACDWLYFQDEEPDEVKNRLVFHFTKPAGNSWGKRA